jgi:hypothetical protein
VAEETQEIDGDALQTIIKHEQNEETNESK